MPTGYHGKSQRTFWVSRVASEKLRRLVAARGGRCGSQVCEEAINLLYRSDPNMAGMPPIAGDELPAPASDLTPRPYDEVDALLDCVDGLRACGGKR